MSVEYGNGIIPTSRYVTDTGKYLANNFATLAIERKLLKPQKKTPYKLKTTNL